MDLMVQQNWEKMQVRWKLAKWPQSVTADNNFKNIVACSPFY